jgi:hypothetical protein
MVPVYARFSQSCSSWSLLVLDSLLQPLQDPKVYVEALLSVYRRYSGLVTASFEGKPMFVGALDKVDLARFSCTCVPKLSWFFAGLFSFC